MSTRREEPPAECANCGAEIPRHAKAYRNFLAEYKRLQTERVAAFREYAADVNSGQFPQRQHLISMPDEAYRKALDAIEAESK